MRPTSLPRKPASEIRTHPDADKRRAVETAIAHEKVEREGLTQRQIAEHVGVDQKTVLSVKRELEAVEEIPQLDRVEGKDGKSYPATRKPVEHKPAPERRTHSDADVISWCGG